MNRPEREKIIMTRNDFKVAKPVGLHGHVLVFVAHQRPNLPAAQAVAVVHIENRIHRVIRNHVPLAGLAVNGKHHDKNLVPEQPAFDGPVERKKSRIIIVRIRRTLLEINWKQRDPTVLLKIARTFTSGKTEELYQLPSVLGSITPVRYYRIKKVVFG